MSMFYKLFIGVCLLLAPLAWGQACYDDLRGDLSDEQLSRSATGLEAAQLLKRAVDLLEPALPQLVNLPDTFNLAPEDEGYAEARFLAQRDLLPADWRADSLAPETWDSMVSAVGGWYGYDGFPAIQELSVGGLLNTLSTLISAVSPGLNPVALVATNPADRTLVDFWAVIRNTSVFPRLIVMRPPGAEVALSDGVAAALPYLGNCAFTTDNFIHAPSETAKRLFLANVSESRMYVGGTSPEGLPGFTEVPSGEESAYLTFTAEAVAPYEQYAAVFDGPNVGPATLLRLLPQVRTNMKPRQVLELVLPANGS